MNARPFIAAWVMFAGMALLTVQLALQPPADALETFRRCATVAEEPQPASWRERVSGQCGYT